MIIETIESIKSEIEDSVDEAFKLAFEASRGNFVAFVGFGEKQNFVPDLDEEENNSYEMGYTSDYYSDYLMDTDRIEFLSNYLNKYYSKEGFLYQGNKGKDCISIELMIYTHIWESYFFLKTLVRLAQLSIGNDYKWSIDIPDGGKHCFLLSHVIQPLTEKNILLGKLVHQSFSSSLRNSFAHSMYRIDEQNSLIEYWCNSRSQKNDSCNKLNRTIQLKECHLISFDDFQLKFFKSAYLSLYLHNKTIEYQNHLIVQDNSYESINIEGKQAYIRVIKVNGTNVFDVKFGKDNHSLYL